MLSTVWSEGGSEGERGKEGRREGRWKEEGREEGREREGGREERKAFLGDDIGFDICTVYHWELVSNSQLKGVVSLT